MDKLQKELDALLKHSEQFRVLAQEILESGEALNDQDLEDDLWLVFGAETVIRRGIKCAIGGGGGNPCPPVC